MRTVVLCIGNREGGDDAIGPFIADELSKITLKDITVIDAGIAPENFTGVIKGYHPDRLIIIDAVEMGLHPGDVRRVPSEKIGVMHISTHGIPLSVIIKYLNQYINDIILIGVQPKNMQGTISKEVCESVESIMKSILSDSLDDITFLS
jgi:hydrogenase 3 maturation protease